MQISSPPTRACLLPIARQPPSQAPPQPPPNLLEGGVYGVFPLMPLIPGLLNLSSFALVVLKIISDKRHLNVF